MGMVFHERFGEIDSKQLAVYKANNVSPADHDWLSGAFDDDPIQIIAYVLANSPNNNFRILWRNW